LIAKIAAMSIERERIELVGRGDSLEKQMKKKLHLFPDSNSSRRQIHGTTMR
jgi:hypothetical protein